MSFSIQYKPLFKVDVLHLFFLNNGLKTYFSMNAVESDKQLDGYNLNSFFNITPTLETQEKLKGHNLVFKIINTGFAVWTKVSNDDNTFPFIPLTNDLSLTFLVKITDSVFYTNCNYFAVQNVSEKI